MFPPLFLGLYVAGWNICLLPMLISSLMVPRRLVQTNYFCWHAELLPHSEQVVFHKSGVFGTTMRHTVDIKNLSKVSAEMVKNPLMWTGNMFDPEMVFMDSLTREVFVFDKRGIWNQDAIEHPLLY